MTMQVVPYAQAFHIAVTTLRACREYERLGGRGARKAALAGHRASVQGGRGAALTAMRRSMEDQLRAKRYGRRCFADHEV